MSQPLSDAERIREQKEFYRRGLKRMAWWLAVNRHGEMLVGVAEKPLKLVEQEIDEGKWD